MQERALLRSYTSILSFLTYMVAFCFLETQSLYESCLSQNLLCGPRWPWTQTDPLASVSSVLGSKECTIPGLKNILISWIIFLFCFVPQTRSHYTAYAGLKLSILPFGLLDALPLMTLEGCDKWSSMAVYTEQTTHSCALLVCIGARSQLLLLFLRWHLCFLETVWFKACQAG